MPNQNDASGKTNFQEPEEIDPLLDEPVINRGPTTGASSEAAGGPTPMHEFNIPPINDQINNDDPNAGGEEGQLPPDFEEMKKQTQNMPPEGSELAAETIIYGYGTIKTEIGNYVSVIREKELRKLQEKGEIDLGITVNYGNQPVTIGTAVGLYNDSVRDKCGLTPGFMERVKPVLAAELQERGVGLSRMGYIGICVATDVIRFTGVLRKMAGFKDELISAIKEGTRNTRQNGYQQQFTQPQAAPAQEDIRQEAQAANANTVQPLSTDERVDKLFKETQQRPGTVDITDAEGMQQVKTGRGSTRRASGRRKSQKRK